MPRNRVQWSEQEEMLAGAYANIASSFSQITSYMKNHLRTVQNGGGVITDGDLEEVFQMVSDKINKNLHSTSQMRVNITTDNVAPKKITTKNTNSNWVSSAINGSPVQFESKQPQKIRISESELKQVIAESVKRVLNESMGQQYRVDLKTNSRVNQQAISQLHSILNNSRGKQIKCALNMFYGNGFTCDATFTTNGNSICTINITSSTQYDKTFEYNTGNAVQQVLNIGRDLCNQWLQTIQQKNQQTMQQQ